MHVTGINAEGPYGMYKFGSHSSIGSPSLPLFG